MLRPASKLERIVLKAMCPDLATDAFLDACRVEPQNEDQSIVDVQLPSAQPKGANVVELAHGLFKGDADDPACFVMLLGDEMGNPRQLDFHGLADGMSLAGLEELRFVTL